MIENCYNVNSPAYLAEPYSPASALRDKCRYEFLVAYLDHSLTRVFRPSTK